MDKKQIRQYITEKKKLLPNEFVKQESINIFKKVCSLPQFMQNSNIFVYVSYNQEVDTFSFINECIRIGKNVFVPKVLVCDGTNNRMDFFKISSVDDLVEGYKGIMEPKSECPEADNIVDGLMIMPGLAFDCDLNRIGYGGGFYDRYISIHPELQRIAVCFDFQILDELACDAFDCKPEIIVSEKRVIYGGGN